MYFIDADNAHMRGVFMLDHGTLTARYCFAAPLIGFHAFELTDDDPMGLPLFELGEWRIRATTWAVAYAIADEIASVVGPDDYWNRPGWE